MLRIVKCLLFFLHNPHNGPMRNVLLSPLLQMKELKVRDIEWLA